MGTNVRNYHRQDADPLFNNLETMARRGFNSVPCGSPQGTRLNPPNERSSAMKAALLYATLTGFAAWSLLNTAVASLGL